MDWRPFKLINASEQRRLAGLVTSVGRDWMARWLPQEAPGEVRCHAASERATTSLASEPAQWIGHSLRDGSLVTVALNRELWQAVAERLFGVPAGASGPPVNGAGRVVDDVLTQAFNDLCRRVVTLAGDGAPSSTSMAPSAVEWRRGSGAVIIEIPACGQFIALLLDARLVAHLLLSLGHPPQRRAAALNDPRHCIGVRTAKLRVWLGEASIELGVLHSLAVGDVVRLDARIDQPLRLTVEDRSTGQRAFLGCVQGKRAVQLAQLRR